MHNISSSNYHQIRVIKCNKRVSQIKYGSYWWHYTNPEVDSSSLAAAVDP
jgi:hypothetical protein